MDREQQELIFDYCLGMSCPSDAARAEAIISENERAAQLHASLQAAIAPLSHLPPEHCPDDLASRTLHRLCEQSNHQSGSGRSSANIIRLGLRPHLSNAAGAVVVAASILLIVGVMAQSAGLLRRHCGRLRCGSQLARVHEATSMYSADYDGFLPAVARAEGASWNAIGGQGPQCCSNTKNPFLLLKLGYIERPEDFLCGGKTGHDAPPLTLAQVAQRDDFPSRDHITYSYRLMPSPRVRMHTQAAKPLMADMNPHFERLGMAGASVLPLRLDEIALRLNSPNHGRHGQNVLAGDGHVSYLRSRHVGNSRDDIYTMVDGRTGTGHEFPSGPNDVMLAP